MIDGTHRSVVDEIARVAGLGRVLVVGGHHGWVEAFHGAGARAVTVVLPPLAPVTTAPSVAVIRSDLRTPLVVDEPHDLAFVAAEVARTAAPDVAPQLVASLCQAATVVAFVVPAPGVAPGVVDRWPPYWDSLFEQLGLHPDDRARWAMWDDGGIELEVRQGLVLYRRGQREPAPPPAADVLRSVVHPEVHHHLLVRATELYEREVRSREQQLAVAEAERRRLAIHAEQLERDLRRAEERAATLSARTDVRLVAQLERHIVVVEERAGLAARELALGTAASAAAERDGQAARYRAVPWREARSDPRRVALRAASAVVRAKGGSSRLGSPAPLFDGAWYVTRYPDVAESPLNPLWHYRRHGAAMGRSPHPMFDVEWYRRRYGAELDPDVDPVVEHLGGGWRHGRDPHPAFLQSWYVETADLRSWARSPLEHYLEVGAVAGLSPHPLCDGSWIRAQGCASPDDYLRTGWRRGIDPHPLFDVAWYLTRSPDVAAAGIDPLSHYLATGWTERRSPHPIFDVAWYLERNPDVDESGMEPLTHFVLYGGLELRAPGPLFDPAAYLEAHPELAGTGLSPAAHFLQRSGPS